MLNYELAKKLKDNGFPQKNFTIMSEGSFIRPDDEIYCNCGACNVEFYTPADFIDAVYCPTLSELIEAVGRPFTLYFSENDLVGIGWSAVNGNAGNNSWENFDFLVGKGETPEEAVANLYLALHDARSE